MAFPADDPATSALPRFVQRTKLPVTPESGRKTKIVCTIGPATAADDQLRALMLAGMNVARLNFSHGSLDEHRLVIERIRRHSLDLGFAIAILQDLAGPKVRIGTFAGGRIELQRGDLFTLTTRPVAGDEHSVSVSYVGLPKEVKPGDTLLLADGAVQLETIEVADTDIRCRVVFGGPLSDRKGVNCPAGLFGVPILGEKDLRDLRFGVEHGVDYIGLSFVRTAQDVRDAQEAIAAAGGAVPVIAKIETQAALAHISEILAVADGIMIARGDLSIETPYARVPVLQKQLIAAANRLGKPVITATQMLFSMVHAPQPTRAEVADVANAIIDGSDAVMLSDETTIGQYPVRAVETLATIAAATDSESERRVVSAGDSTGRPPIREDALAEVACRLAASLGADLIATLTLSGATAAFAAKYRPAAPILAFTPRAETYRRLALIRGVQPVLLQDGGNTADEMIRAAREALRADRRTSRSVVFLGNDLVRVADL